MHVVSEVVLSCMLLHFLITLIGGSLWPVSLWPVSLWPGFVVTGFVVARFHSGP